MRDDDHFEAMVDACLKAHGTVAETGTPEMLALARALLTLVGHEAAKRASINQNHCILARSVAEEAQEPRNFTQSRVAEFTFS